MDRLTLYPVHPDDVRDARADAVPERGDRCHDRADDTGGGGVSKVCPPGGKRGCDWCRQPLPRRHPPGEHRPYDVVLMFPSRLPGKGGSHIKNMIHSEDCLPLPLTTP
jgi:hypothetical protein